tara:strand:- start:3879 stop:4967 length:1089 start_codon:yes stop_codon:yes gene_type:complete
MVKFLDLNKQYLSIKKEIDEAIYSVINDTAFVGGNYLSLFEENFAKYVGCNFCIGVANGTDALEIAIECLDLPKGSEIIVPANSWISSSESVVRLGYNVVFCDVKNDYLIDIKDLKEKISDNTSAIMPVHLYGQICEMNELTKIANENDLKIIEDSAQAHGAVYEGKKAGTFGDVGCYSFYPGKNLGAYGDGGALVTNNSEIANKARLISNHGQIEKHKHLIIGRNSRLDGLQAAILNVKLKYLDSWIERRNEVAKIYLNHLSNHSPIVLPHINKNSIHAFHLYVIRNNYRNELIHHLKNHDIETGIHYPKALSDLDIHRNQKNLIQNASKICGEILSLPMGEHLNQDEVIEVCNVVSNFKK